MRVAVCVKQVPVVSAMQFNAETKTLQREGVPNEVSAFDLRALIKAIELKTLHGGEVVVITMGPPQAREALVECLALGADRALHLCDRAFAGADTLATARALALAIRREPVDLILCGRNSVDAETGQVGPELAELLDLPQVTAARTLVIDPAGNQLTAERETDDGFETLIVPLPALVTAAEDLAAERFPSKAQREAARSKPIVEVHAADLSSDVSQFGFSGSPTTVAGLQHVATTRLGKMIESPSSHDAAVELTRILVDRHGLFGSWKVAEQPAIAEIASSVQRSEPSDVWVLAEELSGSIRPVVCELLGKARTLAGVLGSRVTALLLGAGVEQYIAALQAYGADRVLVGDDARLSPYVTESHVTAVAAAVRAGNPGILLIPATVRGRDLAPRLAARLQLGLTGDCVDIGIDAQGRLLQYKPAFGGSVVAPILSRTRPELATVRPGMLPLPVPDSHRRATIDRVQLDGWVPPRTRVADRRLAAETAAELDRADVVIGVGMGLGSREALSAVQPLAQLLGAALCTTRDVTDAGWLPKHYQVGLTGRAIAPKLYFAIAIRGAFEHLVGVRRAGLIIAINKSAKAPIFKAADYGIVGDYAEVVPAVYRELSGARALH